jgi:transaldolase
MDDYRSVLSNVRPNVPRSYPSLPGAGLSRDPVLVMNAGSVHLELPQAELLWPSPELLNVFQADETGCHIITVSHDYFAAAPRAGTAIL